MKRRVPTLLWALLLLVVARPILASSDSLSSEDYLYGAMYSFTQGGQMLTVLRLAPVRSGSLRIKEEQQILWTGARDEFDKLLWPTGKLEKPALSLISEFRDPKSAKNLQAECAELSKLLKQTNPETGQLGSAGIFIRQVDFSKSQNRDAATWLLRARIASLVPAGKVSLTEADLASLAPDSSRIAFNKGHPKIFSEFVTQIATDLDKAKQAAQTARADAEAAKTKPIIKVAAPEVDGISAAIRTKWQIWVAIFAVILVLGMAGIVIAYRRKQHQFRIRKPWVAEGDTRSPYNYPSATPYSQTSGASAPKPGAGVDLEGDSTQQTNSGRVQVIQSIHRSETEPESQLLSPNEQEIDHKTADAATELELKLAGQFKKLEEDLSQKLSTWKQQADEAVLAWRQESSDAINKALRDRDALSDKRHEAQQGKWQGLQGMVAPDLQATAKTAIAGLVEQLPSLIEMERKRQQWFTRMAGLLTQSGSGFLEQNQYALQCALAHKEQANALSHRRMPIAYSISCEAGSDPLASLRLDQQQHLKRVLKPDETLSDEFDRHLLELVHGIHANLDSHPGRCRVQLRPLVPLCAEMGITWIQPDQGDPVEEKIHLVIDYQVGEGSASTIAAVIAPGFLCEHEGTVKDRVPAHVVVYR
jgi:hypothetical protein